MPVTQVAKFRGKLADRWEAGVQRKIKRIMERSKEQYAKANELRDKIGMPNKDLLKSSIRAGKAGGRAVNSEFRAMKIRKSLESGWREKAIRRLRGKSKPT